MHDEIAKPKRAVCAPLPPMPGLRLGLGRMARLAGTKIDCVLEIDRFQRLALALETRLLPHVAHHCDGSGVEVWFDGYLTEVDGAGSAGARPAAAIAAMFAQEGVRALARLRGSYTAVIWETRRRRALVFNDRRGSRPLFFRATGPHAVALAPTIGALREPNEAPFTLDAEGLAELLLSRTFFDRRSLFREVQRFPAASYLEIDATGFRFAPYWQPGEAEPAQARGEDQLIDELHALVRQAVARVLHQVDRPVLLLSGGVGSRLLLGTILDLGGSPSIVNFGPEPVGADDEVTIARGVAAACNLEVTHHGCEVEFGALAQMAQMYDCRAELFDHAPPPRVVGELATAHAAFISGDSFPGRAPGVDSADAALRAVHFHPLASVPWLARNWLRGPVRDQVQALRRDLGRNWLRGFGQPEPNLFRDRLFYRDRIGNYANALAAGKLRYLEQARPLLDEDLIDFLFRLPAETRCGRRLLRDVMARHHPKLHGLPYAGADATEAMVERFRNDLHSTPGYATALLAQLLDGMDARLAELLDRDALRAFISSVARDGSLRAAPYDLIGRLPLVRRWQRHPRSTALNPLAAVLRLLQVNMYLTA
jgi:hypothetical protein